MNNLLDNMAADAEPEDPEGTATPAIAILGEELVRLRDSVRDLEEVLKETKAQRDDIAKDRLPAAMRDAGLVGDNGKGSFTLANGARIHLRTNVYASYNKANQDAFFAWLTEHGHAAIIKQAVHPQTLKAFVREQRAEGVEIPTDLISVHDETVAVALL